MAEEQTPVFQIQRVYLKDISLEQPNSPGILLSQEQPSVDIQLQVGAETVNEGVFEITVTATVSTKIQDKTVFLVEAKQAGIFEIRNVPQEQLGSIVGIACPQIVLTAPFKMKSCLVPTDERGLLVVSGISRSPMTKFSERLSHAQAILGMGIGGQHAKARRWPNHLLGKRSHVCCRLRVGACSQTRQAPGARHCRSRNR